MKVSFTTKELAALKEIAELIGEIKGERGGKTVNSKILDNLVAKMETAVSSSVKKPVELTVSEFLVMARLVLGPRLKEQLKPSGVWYKLMQNRLDSRGINKAMANVALETCRDTWKGDVWVDTLINSLDKLAVMTPQNTQKGKMGWAKKVQDMSDDSNDPYDNDSSY